MRALQCYCVCVSFLQSAHVFACTVSHRACLACNSNVPRFWGDYDDPGVVTGVVPRHPHYQKLALPAIRSLPRDCMRHATRPMLSSGEGEWDLSPGHGGVPERAGGGVLELDLPVVAAGLSLRVSGRTPRETQHWRLLVAGGC